MTKTINEEKIRQQFEKAKHKAEELIDDPDQMKSLAAKAWEKAKELKEPLSQVWEQLKLMIQMIKAWAHGDYKEAPTTSIIAIVAGLMYLLSPVDLIPDFIPVLGYLDDIFVLGVVFTQVAKDLDAFAHWRAAKPEQDVHAEKDEEAEVIAEEAEMTTETEVEAEVAQDDTTAKKTDHETA